MLEKKSQSFDEIIEEFEFEGAKCSFSTGKYARRSNAAILARMGETVVLVTVDVSNPREGCDYFPLNVEYIERMYAGGIISSSRFVKRERHPSDGASLAARMIDRSIRCRFPSDYRNEVQVVLTVLSYDSDHDPIVIGIGAISAALMISEAPFNGLIAGLRIGINEDKTFVCNKDVEVDGNHDVTDMNFVIGTDGELITMLDVDGNEVKEDHVAEAMELGVKSSKQMIDAQKSFIDKVKELRGTIYKPEYESSALPKDLISIVRKDYKKDIEKAMISPSRSDKEAATGDIKELLYKEFDGKYSKNQLGSAVDYVCKEIVRKMILVDKKRADGRALDEIRSLSMDTGVLPRAHGAALFTRGGTQALTVTTLGSSKLAQLHEGMEGSETRTYMHHYYAPDYTVGQAGKYRYYPKRREIGHGSLAEKALIPVIPDQEAFPYTIRVVSEIMSQCGSSSMASVCGSTLSLMDAGVPIKKPVAGIAIGAVTSDDLKEFELLTDMGDFEDYFGDMDFKVAGTRDGITAIQMDNKKNGLPVNIFKEALTRAKVAREFILDRIEEEIKEPRVELSKYAPKIDIVNIKPKKVGGLIGPGGKIVKNIIEKTGVEINIDDSGKVVVSSADDAKRKEALRMIEDVVGEAEIGKEYKGKVAKVMEFGAFVDITPSISGLVHVSEMSNEFVKDPKKFVTEGQDVTVKVIGIDEQGRVKMSMKQVKK